MWNKLQYTATHCNTLPKINLFITIVIFYVEQTAIHCNTLQTLPKINLFITIVIFYVEQTAIHCNTLQHTTKNKPLRHCRHILCGTSLFFCGSLSQCRNTTCFRISFSPVCGCLYIYVYIYV